MITREQAELIAEKWVNDSAPVGVSFPDTVHDFDPPTEWAWDPAEQARSDLNHVATPTDISHPRPGHYLVISRSVKGDPEPRHHPLVLDFFGSELTYRVRGSGDPAAGATGPPCLSCAMLLRHFGFRLQPPDLSGLNGISGPARSAGNA